MRREARSNMSGRQGYIRRLSLWLSLLGSVLVTLAVLLLHASGSGSGTLESVLLSLAVVLLAGFALSVRWKGEMSGRAGVVLLALMLLAGTMLRLLSAASGGTEWLQLSIFAGRGPSPELGLDLYAGRALLAGLNPFKFSVQELMGGGLRVADTGLEAARTLVGSSEALSQWVGSVAQAEIRAGVGLDISHRPAASLPALPLLAAAQVLTPNAAMGWFGLLIVSDSLALGLLVVLMRRMRVPLHWAALFWVNPLWLVAGFGAGSCLVLIAPLVLLALWASVSERAALTGFLLALCVGFSLWIAALLPLLLRSAGRRPAAWRRAAYGVVGFALLIGIIRLGQRLLGGDWTGFSSAPVLPQDKAANGGLALFLLADTGLLGGATRWAAVGWGLLVLVAGGLLALPPLPDQAQRSIRAGILGVAALFLSSLIHPAALLPVLVLLPLTRAPALVLGAGLGVLVSALTALLLTLGVAPQPEAGIAASTAARLVVGLVIGLLFVAAWLASVRRNQTLE